MQEIKSKILISIPTYNERGNVPRLVEAVRAVVPEADILFIDDNSPDGTGRILDEMSRSDIHIKVLHRPQKSGLGTAHKKGFSYAREYNYDYLVTMDADFLHDPKYIPALIEKAQESDIVVGSRYTKGGSYDGINPLRKKLTYFWRWMIKKSLGLDCDATGSYRVYRVSVLRPEVYEAISSTAYEFNMEALFRFKRSGARISEIPIHAHGREYGESKLTTRDMAAVLKRLCTLMWERKKF